MVYRHYLYFLLCLLVCGFLVGCGKRKPTIPANLVTQRNVSVGARVCDRADYPLFLGCSKFYFPSNLELVQVYVKNESAKKYKFSGKDVELCSSDFFRVQDILVNRLSYALPPKIAGGLVVNVPLSLILGISSAVGLSLLYHALLCRGGGCPEGMLLMVTIPGAVVLWYLFLVICATYKFSFDYKKQKKEIAEKFKKNLLDASAWLSVRSASEINKVFFMSRKERKALQRDGLAISLIEQKTKEKLNFVVSLR